MTINPESLSLIWIALPLLVGFIIYLLPTVDRILALTIALISLGFGLWHVFNPAPIGLQLLNSFGVTLLIDGLSGFFVLTNAVVTLAVILYCWQSGKGAFFYTQTIILHGSVNAVFISADLISVYVAIEVISIATFLLIAYSRTNRSIWVGLRYLFVSNTAMLFYLLGAVLVYQSTNSFAFGGIAQAPPQAIAFIFLGLLTKGGIFVSGLWLPITHSESETPISALLSGTVIKAGVFPLVRFALMVPEIDPIVRLFGVATALLGVGYAVFAKDTKRVLAFHTISQLGFILAAPAVGGFYALTHGLVKSALFLIAGNLPSRNIKELKAQPMPTSIWITLAIASFSISGFPLLAGFGAKVLTSENLAPWQVIGMNIAALGTAISFAKFIFLPQAQKSSLENVKKGFWPAVVLLLCGLVITNGFYYEAYSLKNVVKPLVTIAAGWLAYLLVFQKLSIKLPRVPEQFSHLIGAMTLILTVLFWVVRV
ncbi:MAG: cation:proton antiporter [Cyanothece sp. SIO2G6]|nr:cation:proton antiporter [Cyanothece sp. SIO2G6]